MQTVYIVFWRPYGQHSWINYGTTFCHGTALHWADLQTQLGNNDVRVVTGELPL